MVRQLAEGLNGKNSFLVEVLCCSRKGKGKEEAIKGVKVRRASSLGIFWGMPLSFSFFCWFRKIRNAFDIIDFHHPFPLGDLALLFFKPKGRLIVHYHSDIVRQKIFNFILNPLTRSTLKKAEKIIVSNPNLKNSSPLLRDFREKCLVVPFGIDVRETESFFDKERIEKIKREYSPFVLFVGRLNYYKGVSYLIEAMKGVGANLVIIGEGPEKNNLKLEIRNLDLKNKVFFLPHQPKRNLMNFHRAADVFVLPSIFKSEAFGLVLLEAMIGGTPVISTELQTGTSWVNQNGKTGLVVPPKDAGVLIEALNKILEDKEKAGLLGKEARERVLQNFTLPDMLQKTKEVYIK